jgi:N-acyl-D-aspartate/D-glutamate deacylase
MMSIGYVIPGFIDVHAHWEGYSDRFPAKSWEMQTFLAYGITTLHKYVILRSHSSSSGMNV